MEQCPHDAGHKAHRRHVIANAGAKLRRIATLHGCQRAKARPRPESGDIETGLVRLRTVRTIAGEIGEDQIGLDRAKLFPAKAQPLQTGRTGVGDEHVGGRDQSPQHLRIIARGQIERDRALAAIVIIEHAVFGVLQADRAEELSKGITRRGLHLDHFRAPVRQDAAGSGACHIAGKLNDTNALQHLPSPLTRRRSVVAALLVSCSYRAARRTRQTVR